MSAIKRKATSFLTLKNQSVSTKRVKLNDEISPTHPVVPIECPPYIVPLSEEDFQSRFKVTEVLGKGGFGTAVKAEDNNQNKNSVVVKSFLREKVFNWTDGIPTEIHIMKSLNHKNIVPLLEAFESSLYFRMTKPDTNGKDLDKFPLENIKVLLPFIAREVAQALRYLHEDCLIVHLDIKISNVIIWKEADEYKVQIIDFGCAKRYSKGVKEFFVDGGTDLFSCKEFYSGTKIIGPEADIFSFGVFLYMLYFDYEFLFPEISDIESEEEVKLPEILNAPECDAFRELLSNTLTKDSANRWNINQVLSSKWMQQNNNLNDSS